MESTTLQVSNETWRRLNQRKGAGDSFEDVICSMLDETEGIEA